MLSVDKKLIQQLTEYGLNLKAVAPNEIAIANVIALVITGLQQKPVPEAYMGYALYDADSNLYDQGRAVLSKKSRNRHEELIRKIAVQKDGYIETFLVNETGENVWFDQFRIESTGLLIVQETHYDPWGVELNGLGYQYGGIKVNPYLYNGKEAQGHLGMNLYDYGARMYDPAIGRWSVVDPMAEKSPDWSPYRYGFDNPVKYSDPTGMFEYSDGYSTQDSRNSTGSISFIGTYESAQFQTDLIVFSNGETGEVYNAYIETYNVGTGKVVGSRSLVNNPVMGNSGDLLFGNANTEGAPDWMGAANLGIGAYGIAHGAKIELLDYAIRTNYKSARTYSEFNKLRPTQQAWRTTNTLGKTGASYLKFAKGLGFVGAGLSTAYSVTNAYNYFNNGGTDWRVYAKSGLDVVMTGVGFAGPIGFGVSASYFILDVSTGGFGGFGQIKP